MLAQEKKINNGRSEFYKTFGNPIFYNFSEVLSKERFYLTPKDISHIPSNDQLATVWSFFFVFFVQAFVYIKIFRINGR